MRNRRPFPLSLRSSANGLLRLVASSLLLFGASIVLGQSISILGVEIPTATINKAYQKAVDAQVYGGSMQYPVSEQDYVKAWEAYKKKKEAEERERQRRKRNPRNGNAARTTSSVKVDAGTGLWVRDAKKPSFIEVEAVVVRPGRSGVLIQDEKGKMMLVESRDVLPKTGKPRPFKLKKDPEGRTETIRLPNQESVEVKVYQDFTLSPADFIKFLRNGRLVSYVPELKKAASSGFARGAPKSHEPRKLGSGSNSNFGNRESRLGKGGSGLSSGKTNERSSSGFNSRSTTIKR